MSGGLAVFPGTCHEGLRSAETFLAFVGRVLPRVGGAHCVAASVGRTDSLLARIAKRCVGIFERGI